MPKTRPGEHPSVAVKIKLMRFGKIRAPYYRVVIADSRTARNGRAIEEIGKYHPTADPSVITINSERALYWLGVGALPTESVLALLKITGDWQKFKGLPGTEGTLRVAPPKADKRAFFEAAVKDAMDEPKDGATTAKKKAQEKLVKAAEPVVEPVAEPVVEAVAEPVVEAVAETVVEPVVETVAEPVVEASAEPVAEPVVEAVAEPVVEAVAPIETAPEVVAETVAAEAAEQPEA
jgi:small subunit ribosomal protein S16